VRVAITGGGTGGHIYPALEVARLAGERGAELLYLGSVRGQESKLCAQRGIVFEGFPSQPLYSLKTARGWRALVALSRSTILAKRAIRVARPDVVFSTGGYGAAPVMAAARSLGIPYTIHEANSVPGRSNRMFSSSCFALTSTFFETAHHLPRAIRTGQPIRRELREAVSSRMDSGKSVLVLGGSQGSAFLNDVMPRTTEMLGSNVNVIHAAGHGNFEQLSKSLSLPTGYKLVPYLETGEIVDAYLRSTVAVARSGGTIAEFAMFGLPSVLVPLPNSADDHQRKNALEFVSIGGATLVDQISATPEVLAEAIKGWLEDVPKRKTAQIELQAWDVPDATERIVDILYRAAKSEKLEFK